MAFDARDHLGINVHTLASAYSDVGQLKNFLTYLGVKWVRDDNPNGASLLSGYNVQTVITATTSTTAVTNTNTAIAAGAKAIELLPEPPTVDCMYGTSVNPSGPNSSIAVEQAKLGHCGAIRQFSSGMPGNLSAGLDISQVLFYSFKGVSTNYTAMAAGTWDSAIVTWLRGLPAGQRVFVCYYHEPENNFPNTGTSPNIGSTSYQAAQNHFLNLVKTTTGVSAIVKTICIFTGGIMVGDNGRNIANWWPSTNPDMLGVDMDGITANTSYHDFTPEANAAQTFAASKGIPWAVTEFGSNRKTDGTDSSHATYTTYLQTQAALFASKGAAFVLYWDDSSANLTTTNEINAWKTLVQAAAPMIAAQQTNRAIITAVNGRVPVIASALADPPDSAAARLWGQMPGVTQGNLHLYRGNAASTPWTTHRTAGYAMLPLMTPGINFQVSSTGYHDYTPASDNTPDATAATEIVPDFQQFITDGADKVFLYEAIDEDVAFPTSPAGFYGLCTDDWTPKPQAAAVQAYIATFVTGPTAPLSPLTVVAMAGDTVADVTWTMPTTGTPADNYTVICSDGTIAPQTIIAPTQVAVFAGLVDGTSYTFTVVPNNAQGSATGVISNAVVPFVPVSPIGGVPATGGGGIGSIPLIVKTPFPASYPTPLGSVTPQHAGQVQQLFFYDPSTADLLQISPNQTGIWLNDLDLGFPVVREVTQANPGRNGEYDQTQYFGARAVTLSLTVMDAPDVNGDVQPAGYWLEVLKSWTADPSNRFRIGYQVGGQQQRFMNVRTSDGTSPFIGSGVGRSSLSVQVTLKCPEGVQWEQNPLPNDLAVLVNGLLLGDGRFETIIPQAVAGSGITFPVTFPVTFPAQSTGTIAVPYRGMARSGPEIRIVGSCTDPSITALNPDGTMRGKIAFTGLTLATTDELRIDMAAKTAVRIASGAISSNVRSLMTSWAWFDLLPGPTDSARSYNRLTFNVGSGTAVAKVYFLNSFV